MKDGEGLLKIDALSVGLFGLAVGALTLGFVQVGVIPHYNDLAIAIICLVFGGIVQIVAGGVDIRYHDQLGGTALTMYGFYWATMFILKILELSEGFHWQNILFLPLVVIYMLFSATMVYLAGHKDKTLMILHIFITIMFTIDIFLKFGFRLEYYVGVMHLLIGIVALHHAMVTLISKYTGKVGMLLGKPIFKLQ